MVDKIVKILQLIDKQLMKNTGDFKQATAFAAILFKYKLSGNKIDKNKVKKLSPDKLNMLVSDLKKYRQKYGV